MNLRIILLVICAFPNLIFAQLPPQKRQDVKNEVTFLEAKDVYEIHLADGRILKVNKSDPLTFDQALNWKKGKKLTLGFRDDLGLYLEDPNTKLVMTIRYLEKGIGPIEEQLNKCNAVANNRPEIAHCFHQVEKMWDIQLNHNYKVLMKEMEKENKAGLKAIKQMQQRWLPFRDAAFEAIKNQFFFGTTRHDIVKSQALLLGRLVN